MPADPRLEKILSTLLEQTRARQIEWAPTSRNESYVYSTRNGSISIRTRDQDGTAPFELQIFNQRGQMIEELVDQVLGDPLTSERRSREMRELWRLAGRTALQVDETIDSILNELEHGTEDSDELDDQPPF